MPPGTSSREERCAQIVFDRFHVQRLVSDALDEVRREGRRDLRGTPQGKDSFRARLVLRKNPWNLTNSKCHTLADLQRTKARIYRAYLLEEALVKAPDYRQPKRAEEALKEWLAWASR